MIRRSTEIFATALFTLSPLLLIPFFTLSPPSATSANKPMIKTTHRRTFLCGGGATMLLPFLPSLSEASSKPLTKPSKKLVIMYLPNGMVRRAFSLVKVKKLPSALGGFSAEKLIKDQRHKYKPGIHPLEFTETLQPLARHKDSFTLLTGLDRSFKDGQDVHAQGSSSFLTSVSPEQAKEKGWRYPNGRSLDHVIGDHVGKKSVFPTLEVSCNGYSAARWKTSISTTFPGMVRAKLPPRSRVLTNYTNGSSCPMACENMYAM